MTTILKTQNDSKTIGPSFSVTLAWNESMMIISLMSQWFSQNANYIL